jgi:hypothetical protein
LTGGVYGGQPAEDAGLGAGLEFVGKHKDDLIERKNWFKSHSCNYLIIQKNLHQYSYTFIE